MKETAKNDPSQAADLAVIAAMIDLWDDAIELLAMAPDAGRRGWLRLELMLGANRNLELLNELAVVEQAHSEDPETFYATAYLRAQALWALGQEEQAVEILESLLSARPQYRAGVSLLTLWRGP